MSTRQIDHMFSDESINIHYKAPAGKLLKLNTLSEFELNRIKKSLHRNLTSFNDGTENDRSNNIEDDIYAGRLLDENRLETGSQFVGQQENRLHRSRSSRLAGSRARSSAAGGQAHDESDARELEDFASRVRQARSVDRLSQNLGPPTSLGKQAKRFHLGLQGQFEIDLQRYQRAFLSKRPARGAEPQQSRAGPHFGRALYDFIAKGGRELSLKANDLLELLGHYNSDWALVEDCQSGLQGLVPRSYVDFSVGCGLARRDVQAGGWQKWARDLEQRQVFVNSSSGCSLVSEQLQQLQQQQKRQRQQRQLLNNLSAVEPANHQSHLPLLPMSRGEPITLIRQLAGGAWFEAVNTKQAIGLVWSNDLDIIKQPVLGGGGGEDDDGAIEHN